MKKTDAVEPLIAFKGFNADWTCREFQYELGKTYEHDGDVKLCNAGFHACEYPLDIFGYYPPTGQIAQVELHGVSDKTDSDSKRVAKSITIKAAITIPMLVSASVEYVLKRCEPSKAEHATGDRSASSATGDQSASSATGDQSASSATGDRSASSATGDRSASSATGKNAVAMNIGVRGKAKADKDGAIVLCNHDRDYNIRHIRASKVGENGIKPDTFYILDDAGEFKEVA